MTAALDFVGAMHLLHAGAFDPAVHRLGSGWAVFFDADGVLQAADWDEALWGPFDRQALMTAAETAAANAVQPVPTTISDRQFFQQLAVIGEISEAEAEEAVGPGTIPAPLTTAIDMLPADQQFAARMFLRGATVFERAHPMTLALGAILGKTPEEMDAIWIAAAAL